MSAQSPAELAKQVRLAAIRQDDQDLDDALDVLEARLEQAEKALELLYDSALIVAGGVDPAHLDPGIDAARIALARGVVGETSEDAA